MIIGFAFVGIGYAVFYWGLHHFPGTKGWERYSLWTLVGLHALSQKAGGKHYVGPTPLQLGFGKAPSNPSTSASVTQPQSPSNTTTGSGLTNTSNWQGAILQGLGVPITQHNQQKLTCWNQCEGNLNGQSGWGINNPFNVAGFGAYPQEAQANLGGTPVPTSQNNPPITQFPSQAAGIQATIIRIQEPFAQGILGNLVADGTYSDFANAVGVSGWGTSASCIENCLGPDPGTAATNPQPGGPGVL